MKVGVMIITKDRSEYLLDCLKSLVVQCKKPEEVIVVDSSINDVSKHVCFQLKNKLNIRYIYQKPLGFGQARNAALDITNTEIQAFIDDDCEADKNWIKEIERTFRNKNISLVLGMTSNYYSNNPYACVQQAYLIRWYMETSGRNYKRFNRVNSDTNSDFENVAFKKKFISGYRCRIDLPYRGINDDTELGHRLAQVEKFYFNPKMLVYHKHQTNLIELIKRNYRQGYADQFLELSGLMKVREKLRKYRYLDWVLECRKLIKDLKFTSKLLFWFTLFSYPVPYRIGRLTCLLGGKDN